MAQQPAPERDRVAQAAAALAAAQASQTALRVSVIAQLLALWRSLGSWRNGDIPRFVPQASRVVEAAQRRVALSTEASLRIYAGALGAPSQPIVPDVTGRTGVTAAEAYERPFHDVWRQLGDGATLPDALEAAETHIESLVATDMQLAKVQAAQQTFLGMPEKVVGYRRVLEGAYSCGLCIVASTRRYHKAELLPIHPGCDCDVEPIVGTQDPGPVIGAETLADVHDAIQRTFGADSIAARNIRGLFKKNGQQALYRDVIVVHRHGEIGDVLGVRGRHFKSPSDLRTSDPTGV